MPALSNISPRFFGVACLCGLAAMLGCATTAEVNSKPAAPSPATASKLKNGVESFDAAWRIINESHFDTNFNGVNWEAVRVELRPQAEAAQFEGKDCSKLKLVRKSGHETMEFYDVKTALLAGTISTQESPMGALPVTSITGEYKEFGGVKMPTKIHQKIGPMEMVMTITSVVNNKVADSEFELPAPIKTLIKP